jgi:hypothetical protein
MAYASRESPVQHKSLHPPFRFEVVESYAS